MCGISGIWTFENTLAPDQLLESKVKKMVESQKHRGPEDTGYFSDSRKGLYLGFNRLSFQDLSSAGNQPMKGHRWVIIFNGEIYNFKNLKQECMNEGWIFRSDADSEVILACLEIWGIEKLKHFDGMYSIAAFDSKLNELYLIRDIFGEKPLYYLLDERKTIIFSSELRGIEQGSLTKLDLDLSSISSYFLLQYIPAPRSIYSKVRKVMPGHFVRIKKDFTTEEIKFNDFFNPTDNFDLESGMNHKKLRSELKNLLCLSIEKRLISDVPLGAFLSSGIDSSLVCALITREFGIKLNTFSVGFENAAESEHFQAEKTAKYLGTSHYSLILKPKDFTFLNEAGKILDEPLADSSCLPVHEISKYSSKFVKGIVTGDGGDELFAGYPRYLSCISEYQSRPDAEPWEIYFPMLQIGNLNLIKNLFGAIPKETRAHIDLMRSEFNSNTSKNGFLSAMRKIDSHEYLPGAVLAKVDRMSMFNSLETRTPFLEPKVVKFASNLDNFSLVGGSKSKLLLRELVNELIPGTVSKLPKKGFGFPLDKEWTEQIYNRTNAIKSKHSAISEKFGIEFSERMAYLANSAKYGTPYFAWSTVILESWLREHSEFINSQDVNIKKIVQKRHYYLPSQMKPKVWISANQFNTENGKKVEIRDIDSMLSFLGKIHVESKIHNLSNLGMQGDYKNIKFAIGNFLDTSPAEKTKIDMKLEIKQFSRNEEVIKFGETYTRNLLIKSIMRIFSTLPNLILIFKLGRILSRKKLHYKEKNKLIMALSGEIFIYDKKIDPPSKKHLLYQVRDIVEESFSLDNNKIDLLKKIGFKQFNVESEFLILNDSTLNIFDAEFFKSPNLNADIRSLNLSSLQYTAIALQKVFLDSTEIWCSEESSSLPLIFAGIKNRTNSYKILRKTRSKTEDKTITSRLKIYITVLKYLRVLKIENNSR